MKFILLFIFCYLVSSHGYLFTPTARSGTNNNLRTGPCGRNQYNSPGPIQAEYKPGDTITVGWKADANHGDDIVYRICYDSDATSASDLTNCLNANTLGTQQNGGTTNPETTTFTLDPDKTCERCTLQMDWTNGGGWYGCTDIKIAKPCPDDCSGKGTCKVDGTCDCQEGYSGDSCNLLGGSSQATEEEKQAGSAVALTLLAGSAVLGSVVYAHYKGKVNVGFLEKQQCPTQGGSSSSTTSLSSSSYSSSADVETSPSFSDAQYAAPAVAAGAAFGARPSKKAPPRRAPPRNPSMRSKPTSSPRGPPRSRPNRRARGRRAGGRRRARR